MLDLNKQEILLSFIIPVYNVELYLKECLDSILQQLTNDCEIILINDGSKDLSGNICNEYAKNDSRIHVIHKENGGLSSARNEGMFVARGKYITFIDSDDKIIPGSVLKILQWIQNGCADVCFLKVQKLYSNNTIEDLGECIDSKQLRFSTKEAAIIYLASRPKYPGSAWGKLYKKEFLVKNNLHFPYDRRYSEDLGFIRDCILAASSFDALETPFYQYRQNRQGSITHKITVKNFDDLFLFISESDNKLKVQTNSSPINKGVMSFVAYEYSILLYLYSKLSLKDRKVVFSKMKDYAWILAYAGTKKIKTVNIVYHFFGIRFTAFLIKICKWMAKK